MGSEDRGWYRRDTRVGNARRHGISVLVVLVAVGVGLAIAGSVRDRLQGPAATYGSEEHSSGTRLSIPGLVGFTIGGDPKYAKDDPWKAYLADEATCPGGERTDVPLAQQAETMVCLLDYARKRRGLGPLAPEAMLNASSVSKLEKIVRCRDFDHDACGIDGAQDIRAAGYTGAWGENLYIGGGEMGSPRVALDQWLNSDSHRENLFRPGWRSEGIAVQKLARFGHDRDMTLWVNQFAGS